MANEKGKGGVAKTLTFGFALLFGFFIVANFLGALAAADGQMSTVMGHFFMSSGMMNPQHCLVDYYTHVKGIGYLLCVVYFVAFPAYYIFIDKEDKVDFGIE